MHVITMAAKIGKYVSTSQITVSVFTTAYSMINITVFFQVYSSLAIVTVCSGFMCTLLHISV